MLDSLYNRKLFDETEYVIDKLLNKYNVAIRLSHWEEDKETSIYNYGRSYIGIQEKILPIINNHPLCEKCRIEQIA